MLPNHSPLTPEDLITLAHFSVNAIVKLLTSAGEHACHSQTRATPWRRAAASRSSKLPNEDRISPPVPALFHHDDAAHDARCLVTTFRRLPPIDVAARSAHHRRRSPFR